MSVSVSKLVCNLYNLHSLKGKGRQEKMYQDPVLKLVTYTYSNAAFHPRKSPNTVTIYPVATFLSSREGNNLYKRTQPILTKTNYQGHHIRQNSSCVVCAACMSYCKHMRMLRGSYQFWYMTRNSPTYFPTSFAALRRDYNVQIGFFLSDQQPFCFAEYVQHLLF